MKKNRKQVREDHNEGKAKVLGVTLAHSSSFLKVVFGCLDSEF